MYLVGNFYSTFTMSQLLTQHLLTNHIMEQGCACQLDIPFYKLWEMNVDPINKTERTEMLISLIFIRSVIFPSSITSSYKKIEKGLVENITEGMKFETK